MKYNSRRLRSFRISERDNPNICTIHDIGEENGRAFIAMEYLDGATLKHLISGQAMDLERQLDVAIEVTEGLDACASPNRCTPAQDEKPPRFGSERNLSPTIGGGIQNE